MLVDLTLPVEPEMLAFPGYPPFEAEVARSYDPDGHLSHRFTATTHTGTHIDAPAHYIEGSTPVDRLDLETLVGPADVLDLRAYRGEPISRAILEEESPPLDPGARVVMVTGDVDTRPPDRSFFDEASVLTEDAADWIVEHELSLTANDFLTEGLEDQSRPVHNTVLGAGIPVVEYLCNTDEIAEEGRIDLTCLPLRLEGLDGSPVRAIAELS
jgi:kynurenine formamidase